MIVQFQIRNDAVLMSVLKCFDGSRQAWLKHAVVLHFCAIR